MGRTGTKEKGVAPGGMDSGRISPYLMISKDGNVARVTEFESPGLLYARPTSKNDERCARVCVCVCVCVGGWVGERVYVAPSLLVQNNASPI